MAASYSGLEPKVCAQSADIAAAVGGTGIAVFPTMGSRFRHSCRNKRRRYAKIVALVLVLILVCLLSLAQSVFYVGDPGGNVRRARSSIGRATDS